MPTISRSRTTLLAELRTTLTGCLTHDPSVGHMVEADPADAWHALRANRSRLDVNDAGDCYTVTDDTRLRYELRTAENHTAFLDTRELRRLVTTATYPPAQQPTAHRESNGTITLRVHIFDGDTDIAAAALDTAIRIAVENGWHSQAPFEHDGTVRAALTAPGRATAQTPPPAPALRTYLVTWTLEDTAATQDPREAARQALRTARDPSARTNLFKVIADDATTVVDLDDGQEDADPHPTPTPSAQPDPARPRPHRNYLVVWDLYDVQATTARDAARQARRALASASRFTVYNQHGEPTDVDLADND